MSCTPESGLRYASGNMKIESAIGKLTLRKGIVLVDICSKIVTKLIANLNNAVRVV